MKRLVYGVGINDGDAVTAQKDHATGKWVVLDRCYRRWAKMLERCYSEKWHETKPSYRNVSVCEEWKRYSSFRDWLLSHDGWEVLQLDKDLLGDGTLYSPQTCCLIPHRINNLLHTGESCRGDLPCGVRRGSRSQRYEAAVCKEGKKVHLGTYDTPEQAHTAWQRGKIEVLRYEINIYKDFQYFNPIVLEHLLKVLSGIEDDLVCGRISN